LRIRGALREALAFARGLLRSPAHVGAVVPASRWLSGAIARAVAGSGCRSVLEVGAGTGAVTAALLAQTGPHSRFVAIESDPEFARWLRRRFPGIRVLQGCASRAGEFVEPTVPTVIVSSLPFRSMPSADRARCSRAFCEALAVSADSTLIQYIYGFGDSPPFPAASNHLRWRRAERVLLNLPPASVWILEHVERSGHRALHPTNERQTAPHR
jgi:phosphatidylethanolamine/phosphatidyl-N-methylethanolamine N-methyltransferase